MCLNLLYDLTIEIIVYFIVIDQWVIGTFNLHCNIRVFNFVILLCNLLCKIQNVFYLFVCLFN